MRDATPWGVLGVEVEYDRQDVQGAAALRYVRLTRERGRRERGIGIVSQGIVQCRVRKRHAVWLVSLMMRGGACEDAEVGTYFRSVTSYARVACTSSLVSIHYNFLEYMISLKMQLLIPIYS
jgi:hypothetical protein